jgi:hypothetical protein
MGVIDALGEILTHHQKPHQVRRQPIPRAVSIARRDSLACSKSILKDQDSRT